MAAALQAHGEGLVGYWGTKPSEETAFIPVDEVLAHMRLEDPTLFNTHDLVLESELEEAA